MLLNQSATREATHLPELTAVNNAHKLVVHECILRRLDIAEARFHIGVSIENLDSERYREPRSDQTTRLQTDGKSMAQSDQIHSCIDTQVLRPDDQIAALHWNLWSKHCI